MHPGRVGPGDEVITSPFSFVALGQRARATTGADRLFADIDPRHAQSRSGRGRGRRDEPRTDGHRARCDIFGCRARWMPSAEIAARHGLAMVEDAARRSGRVGADATVGHPGYPSVFAFYPNKQMTTGEGGMLTHRR